MSDDLMDDLLGRAGEWPPAANSCVALSCAYGAVCIVRYEFHREWYHRSTGFCLRGGPLSQFIGRLG
eukprot:4435087-Prymnesium_polylepis.1